MSNRRSRQRVGHGGWPDLPSERRLDQNAANSAQRAVPMQREQGGDSGYQGAANDSPRDVTRLGANRREISAPGHRTFRTAQSPRISVPGHSPGQYVDNGRDVNGYPEVTYPRPATHASAWGRSRLEDELVSRDARTADLASPPQDTTPPRNDRAMSGRSAGQYPSSTPDYCRKPLSHGHFRIGSEHTAAGVARAAGLAAPVSWHGHLLRRRSRGPIGGQGLCRGTESPVSSCAVADRGICLKWLVENDLPTRRGALSTPL